MSNNVIDMMWKTEVERLSHAVSQLSDSLRNGVGLTLEDLSNKTGLSVAELILDGWDSLVNMSAHMKHLETKTASLQLAVDRLLAEAENMASISARIVRETRDEAQPTEDEY